MPVGNSPGAARQVQTHRAARGTVQLVIGQACLFLSGYFITITLARELGPEEYGLYGIILSILFWVGQMSRFGIPNASAKLIAENQQQAPLVAQTAWVTALLFLVAAFGLFWVGAPYLAQLLHIPDGTFLLRLASLDIPIYGMYFIYRGVSEGERKFATLSLAAGIYGLSKVAGILALYLLGFSIAGALMVNIGGSVIALAYIAIRTPIKLFHGDLATAIPMLRLAFPLALGVLVTSLLYHIDLWTLKVLLREERPKDIGFYVAASHVARIPQLGVLAVVPVVFASIARALGLHDPSLAQRYVRGAVRFLWVTLLPVSVLVALQADQIMALLFSTSYASAGPILRLLVFGCSLFAVLDVFLIILQARGEILLSVAIGVGLLACLLVLCVLLIPRYGSWGAAWAMTATMGVGALVAGLLVQQRFGLLMPPSTCAKVILAIVYMMLISLLLNASGLLIIPQFLGVLGVYVLVLALLGELKREDLRPFALWRTESA